QNGGTDFNIDAGNFGVALASDQADDQGVVSERDLVAAVENGLHDVVEVGKLRGGDLASQHGAALLAAAGSGWCHPDGDDDRQGAIERSAITEGARRRQLDEVLVARGLAVGEHASMAANSRGAGPALTARVARNGKGQPRHQAASLSSSRRPSISRASGWSSLATSAMSI